MWKRLTGIMMLAGVLAGCGSHQLNDDALTNRNNNDFRKVTNSQTEENPNMIDLEKGNPAPNVGSDVDHAKTVVKSYENYEPGAVWINGNNMWVTAHTRERLTGQERMKKEALLHKKLIKALPRYDINVKIEEK